MAIGLFALLSALERRVVFWRHAMKPQRPGHGGGPRASPRSRSAACGEKEDVARPRLQPEQLRPRARLLRQPRPRRHLHGPRPTATSSRAGLEVHPRVPSDPVGADQGGGGGRADLAVSYEPEVLLAREQGLDVKAVGAIVDQPLTSLISLPAGGIAEPADLQGKDDRHRRHPLPVRLPGDDPRRRRALPSATSRRSTSASTCCPPCSAARPTRSSAASATSRAWTSSARGDNPAVVPVDQLGVPTYDELVLVAERSRVEDDRRSSACSSRRSPRAPRTRSPTPGPRPKRS